MLRTRLAILAAAAATLLAAPARAQAPGPALPMGMDIRKASPGAWSEYTVTLAELPPFRQRFALVGRDAETHAVEMTSEGGTLGSGKVVMKVVLEADPAKKERVRKLIMQLGDNPPMELKREAAPTQNQFAPLNPKKLVGTQSIKVAAGTFTTKHYRDKASKSAPALDVWVSDEAPPFGIVKMQGSVSQGPGENKYPLTMELSARGKDAKPVITKTPQPFDQAVLMGQMNRAVGNPPPAAPPAKGK
jgi:hypothetical protein